MDLSNLSSDLPPTKPVNQNSVNELNRDLTTEFKNAAKSVASLYNLKASGKNDVSKQKAEFANAAKSVAALYRLTNSSSTLVHHMGYLECLDDLLYVLTNNEDVENWALTKRAEIINSNAASHNQQMASSTSATDAVEGSTEPVSAGEDLHIPQDYAFSFALDMTPSHHFRPSFPPLSVTHSHKQRANLKHMKKTDHLLRLKKQHLLASLDNDSSATSADEVDSDKDNSDDVDSVIMKKINEYRPEHDLKRRRTNGGGADTHHKSI